MSHIVVFDWKSRSDSVTGEWEGWVGWGGVGEVRWGIVSSEKREDMTGIDGGRREVGGG